MHKVTTQESLAELRKRLVTDRSAYAKEVIISSGTCGEAGGSLAVVEAFREELVRRLLELQRYKEAAGLLHFPYVRRSV